MSIFLNYKIANKLSITQNDQYAVFVILVILAELNKCLTKIGVIHKKCKYYINPFLHKSSAFNARNQ